MTDFSNHAMLDIETLGRRAGCPVLQISACTFPGCSEIQTVEADTNFNFYIRQNNIILASKSTLLWWVGQPGFAELLQRTEEQGRNLGPVLDCFGYWLRNNNIQYLWSHGATFDIPILLNAWDVKMNIKFPIPYHNFRDTRTLMDICGRMKLAEILPSPDNHQPHNALHDAVYQANCMAKLLDQLD